MTIADVEAEARALCDADTTSYSAPDMLRRVNNAYEQVVGWLINADGKWQFDDTNYGDFPIGTFTLVSGQGKYSFNDKFLQIIDVQIKNVNGKYRIIHPIDQKDLQSLNPFTFPLRERFAIDGYPIFYDKISSDTIELLPAPDNGITVTLDAGLRIYFKRTADLFTSAQVTTGTKVPGFDSTFHVILSYMAAVPFCMSYKKDRVALYQSEVIRLKGEILEQFTKRSKDERNSMTSEFIAHR
ncbi:MAG TPA: hypothetical protein ENI23_10695 [bacterium]|nr:hypothetical protein [bacterium]